jgi:hypothetical protein
MEHRQRGPGARRSWDGPGLASRVPGPPAVRRRRRRGGSPPAWACRGIDALAAEPRVRVTKLSRPAPPAAPTRAPGRSSNVPVAAAPRPSARWTRHDRPFVGTPPRPPPAPRRGLARAGSRSDTSRRLALATFAESATGVDSHGMSARGGVIDHSVSASGGELVTTKGEGDARAYADERPHCGSSPSPLASPARSRRSD